MNSIYAYASNPDVAKYADWPMRTEKNSLIKSIEQRSEHWDKGLEYSWVITLLEHDNAVGGVSVFIDGSQSEIGYLVHPDYWNKGIATEASQAIVDWLLSTGEITSISASCDTDNIGSIKVLEKLGFSLIRTEIASTVRPQLSSSPRDTHVYRFVCAT